MLKEIRAIDIKLGLNEFKEILKESNKDNSMPIIEITKEINDKITPRNKSIKIIFDNVIHTVIPNGVGIKDNRYYLEIKAY